MQVINRYDAIVIGGGAAAPSPVYAVGTTGTDSTGFTMTTKGGGGGGGYSGGGGSREKNVGDL